MLRPPRRHGKQQQPTQARHPSKQQQASQRSHGAVTSATKLTPIGLWPCLKAINLSSCCHRSGSNAVERKCSKQPRHQSKQRQAIAASGCLGASTAPSFLMGQRDHNRGTTPQQQSDCIKRQPRSNFGDRNTPAIACKGQEPVPAQLRTTGRRIGTCHLAMEVLLQ